MSLALTMDWSADFATVTIVDIAAQSIVADGRAPATFADDSSGASASWRSLCQATQTALDGLAALSLTMDDIRFIEVTRTLPASALSSLLAGGVAALSPDGPVGTLSDTAARELGLSEGCPVHRA